MVDEPLLTAKQVMDALAMPSSTFYWLLKEKIIVPAEEGPERDWTPRRRRRYRLSEVRRALQEHREGKKP
jgi:predicted DNA-binding transcriptional regulator AlpA